MSKHVHQVLKFMGLALAVVFLGPGVMLSPSQGDQG